MSSSEKKATCPLIDNRYKFGRCSTVMALAQIDEELIGEEVAHCVDVMYANSNAGYPHDREEANRWLIPGHIYTTSRMRVERSSSVVELADFPGVWFNTVLFVDWPQEPKQ